MYPPVDRDQIMVGALFANPARAGELGGGALFLRCRSGRPFRRCPGWRFRSGRAQKRIGIVQPQRVVGCGAIVPERRCGRRSDSRRFRAGGKEFPRHDAPNAERRNEQQVCQRSRFHASEVSPSAGSFVSSGAEFPLSPGESFPGCSSDGGVGFPSSSPGPSPPEGGCGSSAGAGSTLSV